MKEILLNQNWYFHIEDEEYKRSGDLSKRDAMTGFGFLKAGEACGFAARRYEYLNWRRIDLPHDYALELPFETRASAPCGLKPINECLMQDDPLGIGRTDAPTFPVTWYRKHFFITESGEFSAEAGAIYGSHDTQRAIPDGIRYFLRFDGVYRDFAVWVNGVYIDRITCGYLGAIFDITDQLIAGESNSIAVRVDCSQYDGWWYDGGGIYRGVKLLVTGDCYCLGEDVYIHTATSGSADISIDLNCKGSDCEVDLALVISKDGADICHTERKISAKYGKNSIKEQMNIDSPSLWDIESPTLYELSVYLDGELEAKIPFGFKDARFDPERGFSLNGRPLKLNGVCLHQDFAGVGVAMPYELTYHKYKVMKEMGVNAVRAVHNPPSPDALTACDALGILIMDETRMFGSSPEAIRQIETLVKRDRNHACLLMWSIGNEEHTTQNNDWGARMARSVKRKIEELTIDPIITYGANNGGSYKGINSELSVRGINYIRINGNGFHPDDYHAQHPHQSLYSSEEASVLSTRSIYKNDYARGFVDAYGYNSTPWTSTAEGLVKFSEKRDYFGGVFVWTGFDYRGEPTPFYGNLAYPNEPRNKSSNFGIVDLCGFPKDVYYYYRAHWRSEPLLHILPHWRGFEKGEPVRVIAHTNCEEVTLYLNGKKISTLKNEKLGSPEWCIPFLEGEIKAVGIKDGREICVYQRTTEVAALRISTDQYNDYILAAVDAVDKYGEIVTTDSRDIKISGTGAEVIGVGNGDPTSRLRERYFEETELHALPELQYVSGPLEDKPFIYKVIEEESHPRFEDKGRFLWRYYAKETPREWVYETEFEASEAFTFLELAGVLGNGEVFLNGEKIAAISTLYKRPYRFDCRFANGLNRLTVKVITPSGYRKATVDGASIGRYVTPDATHKLFGGRALIVLRRTDSDATVKVSSDDGLVIEAKI